MDAPLSARQVDILLFLQLVGPADEGDVAYGLQLTLGELSRIPADFRENPGEFLARRELETLSRMGLVTSDGIIWQLTARGRTAVANLDSSGNSG